MDQRDIDRAIKQLREEFAAALKVLEAKIDAGGPVELDKSAIEARLDAHEKEAYKALASHKEELHRMYGDATVKLADKAVTRLTDDINEGRRATGAVRDELWEEFNRMSEREREGTASKISDLSDKVDAHEADMEQRLTALSGDLTERIDKVRGG